MNSQLTSNEPIARTFSIQDEFDELKIHLGEIYGLNFEAHGYDVDLFDTYTEVVKYKLNCLLELLWKQRHVGLSKEREIASINAMMMVVEYNELDLTICDCSFCDYVEAMTILDRRKQGLRSKLVELSKSENKQLFHEIIIKVSSKVVKCVINSNLATMLICT